MFHAPARLGASTAGVGIAQIAQRVVVQARHLTVHRGRRTAGLYVVAAVGSGVCKVTT